MAVTKAPKKRETKEAAMSQDIPAEVLAEIATKVGQLDGLQKSVKLMYEQMDPLEARLIELLKDKPDGVTLADGRTAKLKDNFIDPKTGLPRNKAFKAAGVNHYEVELK
jgi:hypothetical protein